MTRFAFRRRRLLGVPLVAVAALAVVAVVLLSRPEAATEDHHDDHDYGSAPAAAADSAAFCGEHRLPEAACGICQPDLAAQLQVGASLLVRLPSPRAAALAGVAVAPPEQRATGGVIQAHAEVDYDRNRLVQIAPRVDGVIEQVLVDVGQRVAAGAPLVVIASPEVAAAKNAYLAAALDARLCGQDLARERRLRAQAISSERELQAAEAAAARADAAAAAAAQQLENLGFDRDAIARIGETGDTSARLVMTAPLAGEIIAREAVRGEAAVRHQALLRLADLSRMWLVISAPSGALADLRVGLAVVARFDALPGREIAGELTWIASGLDERTRQIDARAEVPNAGGLLKAGLFGEAEIRLAGNGAPRLCVPAAAVQSLAAQAFVFVQEDADLFALRRVELGPRSDGRVDIVAGLEGGESVVTTGLQTIATELLKSRLGARCAGE